MTLTTATHLNFRGNARLALEFYQSVFGGNLAITTYADLGMPADARGADSVVFGQVEAEGFTVMAYDIPGETGGLLAGAGATRRENGMTLTDQACFVCINASTLAEVQSYWDALADGASIVEPLAASAWSAGFGMLTDRFGVTWSAGVTVG
ncbi:MAG: VOC family protein [Beutenbergiaceae bacterium]